MTLQRAQKTVSPFSEIRQSERERLWMVVASSTLAATGFVIAGVIVALGAI